LSSDYIPPQDLNQYEKLDLTATYDIGDKLDYLCVMIEKIEKKCKESGTPFSARTYYEYYDILYTQQSLILISLFKRPIPPHTKYYKRLAEEFYLINERNFTKVFLQVMDILAIAEELGIPHIIRGSAGSSLVCYLLQITDIDPICEDISLARFMHTRRKDLPDIDIDFPNNTRHLIYERIFTQYGNRVARISNHVAYSLKTAIKDKMREHGYRKFLPRDYKIEEFVDNEEEINEILREAEEIDGTFKNYSLHCGGIIIFDKPIPEEYILEVRNIMLDDEENSDNKIIKWQQSILNKDQVDDYQFIKIDILSNCGLALLWDIDKSPVASYFEDKNGLDINVLNLLAKGGNIGIVYAESRAMFKALVSLKPKCLGDIALALAIIRPVARELKNGYFKDYAEYQLIKEDNERSRKLKKRLGEYIIYDDDAIQYIQELIECNEADADIYRKVFAKSKWKEMQEFRKILKKKRPEISNEKRNLIYDQLCNLSSYSFCKSHAISYAKLVYVLAYHKYYNPKEFWVSALNNCNSSYRRWVYYRECVAVGIKLTTGYKPWILEGDVLKSISNRNSRIKLSSLVMEVRDTENKILDIDIELDKKECEKGKIREYFTYGFWSSPEFFNGCYYRILNKQSSEVEVEFCGLIANYRICKMKKRNNNTKNDNKIRGHNNKKKSVTFATIGYDNGKYVDIVLYGKIGLGKCHIIEGVGTLNDIGKAEWIQVKKWKIKWLR
jgi:DNA polymerase III alpha subunit